jgi:hypothetical protein
VCRVIQFTKNVTTTGLEPATFGFEDQCSTIEPRSRMIDRCRPCDRRSATMRFINNSPLWSFRSYLSIKCGVLYVWVCIIPLRPLKPWPKSHVNRQQALSSKDNSSSAKLIGSGITFTMYYCNSIPTMTEFAMCIVR